MTISRVPNILPLVVLVTSLLATFGLWYYAQHQADKELRSEFDFYVHETTTHIEQRMSTYIQVLYGLKALFNGTDQVTREQFHAYTSSLRLQEQYPGIQGLSHAPLIRHDLKAQHIAEIRRQGFEDYDIKPVGDRDYYTPVLYIEPFTGRNLKVHGYDTYFEKERHATMVQARDTNDAAVSGKLTLVQEADTHVQAGFLVFLPLYKPGMPHETLEQRVENIYGWVTAVFRMGDLMAGLGDEHMRASELGVAIYDGDAISDQTKMYASDPSTSRSTEPARFTVLEQIRFPNHSWTVTVHSTPAFVARFQNNTPTVVAITGFAFSMLLTILAQALVRAKRVSRELEKSKERWRFALEGTGDGVWDWNIQTDGVMYSKRWLEMLGYDKGEFENHFSECESRIHPDDVDQVLADIRAHIDGETPTYLNEHRILHKDGRWRWILDRGMVIARSADGTAQRMIGVHTDITQRKRDENEMRAQRDFTSAVVEAAGNVIVVLDTSGNIVRFNRAAERLTGFQRNEVLGKPVWDFVIPEEQEDGVRQVFENLKSGQTSIAGRYQNDWLKRDGSRATLDWHNTILYNDEGEITHIVALGYDVTERIKDEDNIRRLSRLYSSLSHCGQAIVHSSDQDELFPQICQDAVHFGGFKMAWIGMVDQNDRRVEPVACFGEGTDYLESIATSVNANDPAGQGPTGTAIREDRPVWCQHYDHDSTTSRWHRYCVQYGWKSSAAIPLRVNGATIGAFNLYAGEPHAFDEDSRELLEQMASDVSYALEGYSKEQQRREAEAELNRLNANLESIVNDRTDELMQAKELADSASQAKTDFLSNMSHEIRTPLAAIIGFSQALRDEDYDESERQKITTRIVRNGEHLQQIISDILDLSKIESGQLEIEQIATSPFAVLGEIDSQLGMIAGDKDLDFNISYRFPIARSINTDPTYLKQILINLCSNAIKFTAEGFVRIEVSSNRESGQIQFDVIDSGIGMAQREIDTVFDPFSQADNTTTRKYGGTGLGLPISSKLALALGGELYCKSEKGKGSRFTLTIPTNTSDVSLVNNTEEADLMTQSLHEHVEIKPLSGHVLLVEDNPDNRELIEMYVHKTGAKIDFAKNGRQGVEMAAAKNYDLILMDMQMPVMDGVEAIKLLRENGYSKPIVSLTANAMLSNREECFSAGANDYLVKPINLSSFYEALNKYLARTENTDDSAAKSGDDIHNRSDTFYSSPGYLAIVERFKQKLPALIEEIADAVHSSNWDVVQSKSHDLKGMGGTMGFAEITEVAGKMNNLVKEKDYERVLQAHAELENQCQSILSSSG